MFSKFIKSDAWDMFLIGAAGTGKTTKLKEYVQYCIDNEIPYVVCAYTHQACSVLASKLPPGANIRTLHSFLQKRPWVNKDATKLNHVSQSSQFGTPDTEPRVMFLDEYSMVGERDEADIRLHQDPDYTGIPRMRVVWVGDLNQLGPVGDKQTITPKGDYIETLTKIWRNDNPLQEPLNELISFIEGTAKPHTLTANSHFIRGQDIVAEYLACESDKIMLAFTNRRVQWLNREIQGRSEPLRGDLLFCPNNRQNYIFNRFVNEPDRIERIYGDGLELGSKFKTLECVHQLDVQFAEVTDMEGATFILACVFGHYDYKVESEALKQEAVETNALIERKNPGFKAAAWAKFNAQHVDARRRSKAWREFLSFDECVVCLDFPHAMTVHKSQGGTYHTVFLDTDDLATCRDFDMYLKLTYVGISRASDMVVTN